MMVASSSCYHGFLFSIECGENVTCEFTITGNVTEEKAKHAAEQLSKTLRQHRLFDVDVEVILADDDLIEPYTHDWTLRVQDRHKFLEELQKKREKGYSPNGAHSIGN